MLAAILLTTASPALADGPGCSEPAPEGAPSLHLATLNAWGFPAPIARERGRRMSDIGRWVTEEAFDVVGLQEVWRGAQRLLDLDRIFFPESRGDSGLALVSPHATSEVEVHPFSAARGFDRFKAKGVLSSRVDLPGEGLISILVTHMQAGGSRRSARVRAAQLDEILDQIEEIDGPVVLMGDFNFYRDHPIDDKSVARLLDLGFVDAAGQLGVKEPTFYRGSQRYDRIYLREGDGLCLEPVTAEVVPYGGGFPFLSDHRPVRVEVVPLRRTDAIAAEDATP